MLTLTVSISDQQYQQFGLTRKQMSFEELLRIVYRKLAVQALKEAAQEASKTGLADMTIEEINEEIKAYRLDAKNRP